MSENQPKTLLANSRREAIIVLVVWAAALVWTLAASYLLGPRTPGEPIRAFLGIPLWVWVGILLPWAISTLVTIWFCLFGIADDDLGPERKEGGDA